MHYLTNYYKNLCEQLQEKIYILEKTILMEADSQQKDENWQDVVRDIINSGESREDAADKKDPDPNRNAERANERNKQNSPPPNQQTPPPQSDKPMEVYPEYRWPTLPEDVPGAELKPEEYFPEGLSPTQGPQESDYPNSAEGKRRYFKDKNKWEVARGTWYGRHKKRNEKPKIPQERAKGGVPGGRGGVRLPGF